VRQETRLLIGTDVERRLGLTFVYQDGCVLCEITFGEDDDGCDGRVPKGLLPFVMEAATRHLVAVERGKAMTSQEVTVSFLAAMTCGRAYVVRSRLLDDRKGTANAIAWIADRSGEVPATMKVLYAAAAGR
jgi:hypothetical protein